MQYLTDLLAPPDEVVDIVRAAQIGWTTPSKLRQDIDKGLLHGWRTHRGHGARIYFKRVELLEHLGIDEDEAQRRLDEIKAKRRAKR